jgi:uncharacterized protein YjbI with pentapeptide repeats
LPSNIFIQFLAGPTDVRKGLFGLLLQGIAWVTLVVAPVVLLLLLQIQFLPFHNIYITWFHRLALALDLALLWWLWRKILSAREADGRWPVSWDASGIAAALILLVGLFSWMVATFPGEWQEVSLSEPDHSYDPGTPHDLFFNHTQFSNRLLLGGLNIYEGLNIVDPKSAEWRDFLFDARGRDLNSAIFDFANLPKVAFSGADLEGAKFQQAQLQGASFDRADLRGAWFFGSQLQNASLSGAQLQGARLDSAQLQGALLEFAHLQGASLDGAHLQGALLDRAELEGASLRDTQLQGATLTFAELQGATLDAAWLKGAVLDGAHLEGASLHLAKLSGASLKRAQLQGASLRQADLIASDLSAAFLWRADFGAASKDAAALVDLRLPPASDQWLPVWMNSGNVVAPWKDDRYQHLRERMELIPAGSLRDQALDRIRRVDCANPDSTLAPCSPPVDDTSQQKTLEDARVDDPTYAKYLAAVLKDLVCNGVDNGGFYFTGRMPMIRDSAIYVLRGLMYAFAPSGPQYSRIGATGPEAASLSDSIESKDCLVFTALTDADRAALLQIHRSVDKMPGQ